MLNAKYNASDIRSSFLNQAVPPHFYEAGRMCGREFYAIVLSRFEIVCDRSRENFENGEAIYVRGDRSGGLEPESPSQKPPPQEVW